MLQLITDIRAMPMLHPGKTEDGVLVSLELSTESFHDSLDVTKAVFHSCPCKLREIAEHLSHIADAAEEFGSKHGVRGCGQHPEGEL